MPSQQIAEICRRRGGSGCGGVSRMDAATELTWTYLQRPPQPDPPRHPTDTPLLSLTLIRRVQGAALHQNPTLTSSGSCPPADASRRRCDHSALPWPHTTPCPPPAWPRSAAASPAPRD